MLGTYKEECHLSACDTLGGAEVAAAASACNTISSQLFDVVGADGAYWNITEEPVAVGGTKATPCMARTRKIAI